MRFEDDFTINHQPEDESSFSLTDRDLLNELKKPVATPDFAPVVMSRLHRAMPGLTGHAGRRQAWFWRMGLAASVLLVLTISVRYGMNEQRAELASGQELLPTINDIVRSIETRMDSSGNNLNTVYGAAGEVASHLRPFNEDAAKSHPQRQNQALPSSQQATRRSIFPVEQSYWSNANNPHLGPVPDAEHHERNRHQFQPAADSATDESADQNRDKLPPDPMPGNPKFAFSIPSGR